MNLKVKVLRAARLVGLFHVARYLTRNKLRILGYHGVWFLEGHYGNRLFMRSETFRSRMSWLRNSGYNVIGLDQAVKSLASGGWPPCATVITIDDGWFGSYKYMLPILEEYELPATLYVYTGAVDSQRPLLNIMMPALIQLSKQPRLRLNFGDASDTIDMDLGTGAAKQQAASSVMEILKHNGAEKEETAHQVARVLGFDYPTLLSTRQFSFMTYEEISDANRRGLDIQLHTHTHNVSTEFPAEVVSEVKINRAKLAPHVRSSLRHFCYPSGINSPGMQRYLEESDVASGTLVETGLVSRGSNRYALNRILDGEETTQVEFEAELSGFLELLRRARRVLKVA